MKNVFDSYKDDIKYRIWLIFWYYKEEPQSRSVHPQLIPYGFEKEEEANRICDLLANYAENKHFGVRCVEIA